MKRPENPDRQYPGPSAKDMRVAVFVLSNLALNNIQDARANAADPRGTMIDDYQPPAEHAWHSLDALESELYGQSERASDGYGQDAIPEDGNSHERIARAIKYCGVEWLSKSILVGEEAELAHWRAAELAAVGAIVLNVDSIDGSSNFDTSGEGFSTNLALYVKTDTGKNYQLLLEITVTSSGATLASLHRGDYVEVYCRDGHGPLMGPMAGPLSKTPRAGYIAAVAMAPHQRERIAPLLATDPDPYWGLPPHRTGGRVYENPAPFVHTMGGAPATIQLAMYRRDTMLTTEPQTLHDSTGIPALLALGMTAYDSQGLVERTELMKKFNQLERPHTPGYKPIPALVIGRDAVFVRKVAAKIFNAPQMRLIAVPKSTPPVLKLVDGEQ